MPLTLIAIIDRDLRCPLLAQSGHPELHCTCPLLGVKRTLIGTGAECIGKRMTEGEKRSFNH